MKYLLLAGYFLLACLPLRAQLDNTFSGNGKVTVNGPSGIVFYFDMLLQPADQKIVVAGTNSPSIFLARLLPSGQLDAGSFGTGGTVDLDLHVLVPAMKIGLQSSGKIVLGSQMEPTVNSSYPTLLRLNADGSADGTFTSSPYMILSQVSSFNTLTIQPDDKILVGGPGGAGIVVARYTRDGVIDPGFGSNGVATTSGQRVIAMTVDANGNIDVLSVPNSSGTKIAVTRFSKTGVADPNFGTNGTTTITVNGNDPLSGSSIFIQSDGNILIGGDFVPAGTNTRSRFLIVRLDYNGHFDLTFAGNGKLGVDFPGNNVRGHGVLQDYQGSIYMTGSATSTTTQRSSFALCRVTPNGVLDTRFGTGGEFLTSWSGKDAFSSHIIQQQNGKILTGGGLEWVDGSQFAIAVTRYNNPIILPPLPRVAATDSAAIAGDGAAFGPVVTSVRLFPNPVGSTLRVQGLDAQGSTLLLVRDAAGKTMMRVSLERQSEFSLDVQRLGAGTYFLEVVTGDRRKSLEFVKGAH